MSQLALHLLGPPRVEVDGEPVQLSRRKMVALLVYLAVTGRSHSRDFLATLLWPEYDQSSALAYLRRILSMLNKALGEGWLAVDRETAGLNAGADPATPAAGQALWLDVDAFRGRLAACETHDHPAAETCAECLLLLEEAVALYGADFMAGFTLRDSPAFDEFQFFQTEGLRDELASALQRLVGYHNAQGSYEQAIPYARRWLGLDPLHEPAHRCLMGLYAGADHRSAALRQYQECAEILKTELGLAPSAETTSLYEQIRTRAADREGALSPAPLPRHNLPAQSTPFIGRQGELAEVKARLEDPDCRLLTLVGPGGSGKTRLALQVATDLLSEAQERFEHGVFFVSLAPLRSAEAVVPTTASALDFSFYGRGEPQQQLLDYLRQKRMLIVMDNYEHLLTPPGSPPAGRMHPALLEGTAEREGADLVTEILKTAPGVKILATSRARLNVGGEHLLHLAGMDVPDRETLEDAAAYSAVQLFLQSARRVKAGFEPAAGDLQHVSRICRLVQGMPLAILMAAAWTEMLAPAEIAAEIGQSLDFLETGLRDMPARQRSMRAVFDHSWRLLTEREREVFQQLSVFSGGFTREAAEKVTGASLHTLLALVGKSFLTRTPAGRYEVHELLRQYAEEKLDRVPSAGEAARDRHSAYYTAALQRWEAGLKGPRQRAAMAEMGAEIENARAAWDWAAERRQVERLGQALEGLSEFYWAHWRLYEGEAACRTAAEQLAAMTSGDGPVLPVPSATEGSEAEGLRDPCPEALVLTGKDRAEGLRVLARLLARQADFSALTLGRAELTNQLLRQSLSILEGPELAGQDIRAEKAFVLLQMGQAADYFSDYEQKRQLLQESLALYLAVGDRYWTAFLLYNLAFVAGSLGAHREAKRRAEEGLAIGRALGHPGRVLFSLLTLGRAGLALGQLEEAERSLREGLAIAREAGGRGDLSSGLFYVGRALVWLGRLDEAHSLLEESLAIVDDLGIRTYIANSNAWLGHAKVHLGQYARARARAQMSLASSQEPGEQGAAGVSLLTLGSVALADGAHAEAQQLLQESVVVSREMGTREAVGRALAVLGYAARGLGHLDEAGLHLREALETEAEGGFTTRMLALPAVALLLADRGEAERAVELYALASRYRFVANSLWFEDIAGKHISAVAAALPPGVVAAAQERGRARDLDATVRELLEEWGT
jgi:predicted ATPase/DNA-binding SARP family transcriptional activator